MIGHHDPKLKTLCTQHEDRDTCTQKKLWRPDTPQRDQKEMQPSHLAENQGLQPRDVRWWGEAHIPQHGGKKTEPEPQEPRRAGQSESRPTETYKGMDTAPGNLPLLFPQKGRAQSQEWGHHHCHHSTRPPRPSGSSGVERMARGGANKPVPRSHPPSTYIHLGTAAGLPEKG